MHAQNGVLTVFEDWHTKAGTQNTFQRSVVRTKLIGGLPYYFVAGATLNSNGDYDMMIQKLDASGNVVWMQQYAGPGNGDDVAMDVQFGKTGNVFITGSYYHDVTEGYNAITIAYNSAGVQLWVATYNGNGSYGDGTVALSVDDNTGDVYAAGSEFDGLTNAYDLLVIKYDNTGTQQWVGTWDGFGLGLSDGACRIRVNGSDVTAAGASQSASNKYNYCLVDFSLSTGSVSGYSISGGSNTIGVDMVTDLQVDDTGNVYVTGGVVNVSTGYDYRTVKLDTLLNIVWTATYDGAASLNDIATGLFLDTAGNVIVTGSSATASNELDYATIKYNSNGVEQWAVTYNGVANSKDSATAIVVKDTNQIYVTGFSYDSVSTKNYHTIKYDGDGNQLWSIEFNSPQNGSDIATAIATDSVGAIIVAGQSRINDTTLEYNTVRYIEQDIITPPDPVQTNGAFAFEENRGQLYNTDTLPETSIKYYNKVLWPGTYFADTSVSYVWAHIGTSAANDTMHRVDMKLVNSNATRVYPMNKQNTYYNYLLGQLEYPLPAVPLYANLIYPEAYSKIDLMYSSNMIGLKYYFIIRPGGNPSDIRMAFNGADSVRIDNDTLKIYSILGVLKQRQATAFEIDNSGNRVALAWQPDYTISGSDTIVFTNIGAYTNGRTLVLECDWGPPPSPAYAVNNLEWSTFFGVAGEEEVNDVVANTNNYVWATGYANYAPFAGQIGQTIHGFYSSQEAFVTLFDNIAVDIWVTYLGGSDDDQGAAIAIGGGGTSYIVGSTTSANFVGVTSQGINYPYQGGKEGFFVALDINGLILCDSYIGGIGHDEATGIAVKKGTTVGTLDIYIVGQSNSNSNFPFMANGNYNQTNCGGGYDAFIMKLDISCNNIWTSFFGGSGDDYFKDVALRTPGNNPVIVGGTNSSTPSLNECDVPLNVGDFPFCDNNGSYYSQTYGGNSDAIIVEFDNSNQQLLWSTYFGGTGTETSLLGLEPSIAIINSSIYLVGGTDFLSANSFPILNSMSGGNYNQTFGSNNNDQNSYIARFNTSRQQTWTTFFGGEGGTHKAYSVCGDAGGNVYFTGFCTPSTVTSLSHYCTVAPTNEAPICNFSGLNYMETNAGLGERSYIAAFDPRDNILWSTLFGITNNNNGKAVDATFDKLFIGGKAIGSYTLVEYNTSSINDYYLPVFQGQIDGAISRFDISQILGINSQFNLQYSFNIYPNPSSEAVYLQILFPLNSSCTVLVTDIFGKVVQEHQLAPGQKDLMLDISPLASGIYFVQLISDFGISSQKLVKM